MAGTTQLVGCERRARLDEHVAEPGRSPCSTLGRGNAARVEIHGDRTEGLTADEPAGNLADDLRLVVPMRGALNIKAKRPLPDGEGATLGGLLALSFDAVALLR